MKNSRECIGTYLARILLRKKISSKLAYLMWKKEKQLFGGDCKKTCSYTFCEITGKHQNQRLFSHKVSDWRCFLLTQVFTCELCKFLESRYFVEHFQMPSFEEMASQTFRDISHGTGSPISVNLLV